MLITSNFTGTDVVLFGSVERDAASIPRRSGYDIVVTVLGPRQTVVVRVKDRVLGIWANVEFARTSSTRRRYIAVLATNPVLELRQCRDAAPAAGRAWTTLRCRSASAARSPISVGDDPFRAGLIRVKNERGLYREEPNGVTFLTPTLFRTAIPLPAEAPVGTYDVDVKLFADGAMVARDELRVRDRQGRLRAVRRQCRARLGRALRPRHRDDGALHRLVRQRGVPARLKDIAPPLAGEGYFSVRQAARRRHGVEPPLAQHVRGEGKRGEHLA